MIAVYILTRFFYKSYNVTFIVLGTTNLQIIHSENFKFDLI